MLCTKHTDDNAVTKMIDYKLTKSGCFAVSRSSMTNLTAATTVRPSARNLQT